jgi:hypothetical protein
MGTVHQEPLNKAWAVALLAAPDETGRPLAQSLFEARKVLADVAAQVETRLKQNPLTPIVAQAAARQAGRWGDCTLAVDAAGVVILRVTTADESNPPLETLQEIARERGLNPEQYPDKATLITAIESSRKVPSGKMLKTSPALSLVTLLTDE